MLKTNTAPFIPLPLLQSHAFASVFSTAIKTRHFGNHNGVKRRCRSATPNLMPKQCRSLFGTMILSLKQLGTDNETFGRGGALAGNILMYKLAHYFSTSRPVASANV